MCIDHGCSKLTKNKYFEKNNLGAQILKKGTWIQDFTKSDVSKPFLKINSSCLLNFTCKSMLYKFSVTEV